MRKIVVALAILGGGFATAQTMVSFESLEEGGGPFSSSSVRLGAGRLATIAVVGANPHAAKIGEGDGKTPLETIGHDSVTGLTILRGAKSEPEASAVQRGETFGLKPGDPLYLSDSAREAPSRFVKWETSYRGKVLPVALLRVHHPGESAPRPGTPLYDEEGKLMAICHQAAPRFGNGTFALPVEAIARVEADLKALGRVARCWIGITINASDAVLAIEMVRQESPGAKAGLRKGDVLLSVGRRAVGSYGEARNAFYYLTSGEPTVLQVLRGTQRLKLAVVPEENPALKPQEGSGD